MPKINLVLLLSLFSLLSSCNDIPYDKTHMPAQAANDIGIPQESIVHHAACEYGRGSTRYADAYFYPCIYIDTDSFLSLLDFDPATKKYTEVVHIAFSEAPEIAIARNFIGDQLQIKAKSTYLLIKLKQASTNSNADHLYNYLISRGLKSGDSVGFINSRPHNISPTPVTIPIYVPAAK